MIEFLLLIFYFARPITTMDIGAHWFGLKFFELATIVYTLILFLVFFANTLIHRRLHLTRIDVSLILFIIWCLAISLIYLQDVDAKLLAKWVLPPATYIVVKSVLKNQRQFLPFLVAMTLGAGIAALVNGYYLLHGKGLETENYWTGLLRYSGLYDGSHTLGHSMGLLMMLLVIVFSLFHPKAGLRRRRLALPWLLAMGALGAVAAYCVYQSQVRTVYVGLLVFFATWLFLYSKKLFSVCAALGIVGFIAMLPYFSTLFFDVVEATQGGDKAVLAAGSGRPMIWKHNLEIYRDLSLDRKIAGVGIGNIMQEVTVGGGLNTLNDKEVWNSHNDYLEVLMETGLFGLIIIIFIYAALFKKIRRMPPMQRAAYLAFFLAVVVMNILSNSYISRFALAQMFFMVMVFVELRETHHNHQRRAPIHGRVQ